MTNNSKDCETFLSEEYASVSEYVDKSQIKYVGHCATNVGLQSTANLSGLHIYLFNGIKWEKCSSKSSHLYSEGIYLQKLSNHFEPILCIKQSGDDDICFAFCKTFNTSDKINLRKRLPNVRICTKNI